MTYSAAHSGNHCGATMQPEPNTTDPLSVIIADFHAAGIRPTPLGVISVATDRGLSDGEIRTICDALAAQPDLTLRAA